MSQPLFAQFPVRVIPLRLVEQHLQQRDTSTGCRQHAYYSPLALPIVMLSAFLKPHKYPLLLGWVKLATRDFKLAGVKVMGRGRGRVKRDGHLQEGQVEGTLWGRNRKHIYYF